MTDRKLPVLLLAVEDIETMRGSLGHVWAIDAATEPVPQHAMARYESAVPRCRTCSHFAPPVEVAFPNAFCQMRCRSVPNNGSGYSCRPPARARARRSVDLYWPNGRSCVGPAVCYDTAMPSQ